MKMAFFLVKDLSFKYNENWILSNISFQGKKGELIAIVGPSGCGKTTLLRTIVGILNPQQGSVVLDQVDIIQQSIEKRRIGYVPQNQALFPHLTVYENIAFGLLAQKWKKSEIEHRVMELVKLGGLSKMLQRRPHELSGGQQQRVALLRALAPSPKLLLLDEPLSNIDAHLRERLAMYIRNIQRISSITTLFVTHDLNEAKMLADKLIIINEKPESVEAAQTLGLKNLYEVYSIVKNEKSGSFLLSTEIGKIHIPQASFEKIKKETRGIYIDPIQITVTKGKFFAPNSLVGEIIAIIPEPMVRQSTLLIKISQQNSIGSLTKILRVQLQITEVDFQIYDQVTVTIPPEALHLYS
jgi:ABC-type sugar transport system ATPase subunit